MLRLSRFETRPLRSSIRRATFVMVSVLLRSTAEGETLAERFSDASLEAGLEAGARGDGYEQIVTLGSLVMQKQSGKQDTGETWIRSKFQLVGDFLITVRATPNDVTDPQTNFGMRVFYNPSQSERIGIWFAPQTLRAHGFNSLDIFPHAEVTRSTTTDLYIRRVGNTITLGYDQLVLTSATAELLGGNVWFECNFSVYDTPVAALQRGTIDDLVVTAAAFDPPQTPTSTTMTATSSTSTTTMCGNAVVDPGEQCDGGECCAQDCRLRGSSVPCGGITPVCQQPRHCEGTTATCPEEPANSGQGEPCFPDSGCTIGRCDGRGTCDPIGPVCDANAKALRNGTRRLKIKVVCESDAAGECAAAAVATPALTSAAGRDSTDVLAATTDGVLTEPASAQTRRRRKKGLRFKTTLKLKPTDQGLRLLEQRDVDAVVQVTIRRGSQALNTQHLLHLLRIRK